MVLGQPAHLYVAGPFPVRGAPPGETLVGERRPALCSRGRAVETRGLCS